MKETKKLYGISAKALHTEIARALNKVSEYSEFGEVVHSTICNTRIDILKENLAKRAEKNLLDPILKDISDAIDFWEQLRDE